MRRPVLRERSEMLGAWPGLVCSFSSGETPLALNQKRGRCSDLMPCHSHKRVRRLGPFSESSGFYSHKRRSAFLQHAERCLNIGLSSHSQRHGCVDGWYVHLLDVHCVLLPHSSMISREVKWMTRLNIGFRGRAPICRLGVGPDMGDVARDYRYRVSVDCWPSVSSYRRETASPGVLRGRIRRCLFANTEESESASSQP